MTRIVFVKLPKAIPVSVKGGRVGLAVSLSYKKVLVQFGADGPFEKHWFSQVRTKNRADDHELWYHRPKLRPLKPEVREARDKRWQHFGAIGRVGMATQIVRQIEHLPTATAYAKNLAKAIEQSLEELRKALDYKNPIA